MHNLFMDYAIFFLGLFLRRIEFNTNDTEDLFDHNNHSVSQLSNSWLSVLINQLISFCA